VKEKSFIYFSQCPSELVISVLKCLKALDASNNEYINKKERRKKGRLAGKGTRA
jgi:hypothetical protein